MSDDKKKTPEAPKADTRSEIAEAVKQAIEAALPTAVSVAASVLKPQPAPTTQTASAPTKGGRCQKCGQNLKGCKDKHRLAVVYPRSQMFDSIFPGIKINGVRYRSNGPGHKIHVPLESDVEYLLKQWERQEEINLRGRSKMRKSARLSPSSAPWVNPEPVSFE